MNIFCIYKSYNNNNKYKLDVWPNNKVIDIKTKLKELTGVFIKGQRLFYNTIEMENDKKISYYSIPDRATLNLFETNIYYTQVSVKPPIGRPIDFEVTQSTTIKEIKDEIFKLRGIPQSKQQIIPFDNKPTYDYSIALNSIHQCCTAKLKYTCENPKKILIKPSNHDYIQLLVDENDTIDDIKYEAGLQMGYYNGCNDSELMFSGIKLENGRKIKDYLLPRDAILNYLIYRKSGIIVCIKNGYGQFIPLEVTPKEKILSIKQQIQEIEGTLQSQQDLFFEGKILRDENELQFYRVDPFSVIELKILDDSRAAEQVHISLKLPSVEEPFHTNVDPMIQVKDLKSIIESIIGLKSSEQKLIFQCKQLEDEFTLHHYSITDNSMILVSSFERKQIKITVNISSEKALTFDMNLTDFTKDLKMKINEQTGFPVDKQALICKFKFLRENDSFQSQKITSDATVNLFLIERGGFYIQVKTSFDKYIPIEVRPDDTLLYIKNEILKKEGIPINERTLNMKPDDTKVSESSLRENCTLHYTPYKQGAEPIYIKTFTGSYLALYFRSDDKISEIYKVIELMEGVPIRDQRLIFAGKQLDDDLTLKDCSIRRESTINLVLRLRG